MMPLEIVLKNFALILANIINNTSEKFKCFNLHVEDESRFELFTKNGKSITAKGV